MATQPGARRASFFGYFLLGAWLGLLYHFARNPLGTIGAGCLLAIVALLACTFAVLLLISFAVNYPLPAALVFAAILAFRLRRQIAQSLRRAR